MTTSSLLLNLLSFDGGADTTGADTPTFSYLLSTSSVSTDELMKSSRRKLDQI